jgi:phosphoglycolate phosphatase
MRYKLAIFDFDGTLADSFPFFLGAINALAEQHNFAKADMSEIEALRKLDAKRILKTLGVPFWKVPILAGRFRKSMAQHTDEIPMFEGVTEMLHTLSQHGMLLSLVTSNSDENVRSILGSDNVDLMVHPQYGTSLFGKAKKLKKILNKTGVGPVDAIYIGDEIRDLKAADAELIDFGAVTWGYTSSEAFTRYSPTEIFLDIGEVTEKLLRDR